MTTAWPLESAVDQWVDFATQLHPYRGKMALYLGHSLSDEAGIPRSEVWVGQLVEELAQSLNEETDGSPLEWYFNRYGDNPDYRDVVGKLLPASQRTQRIHDIFTAPSAPTQNAPSPYVEQFTPTLGHHAIAHLVSLGFFPIIITPTVDNLLEQALEQTGIEPVIISTSDGAKGAPPFAHNRCTILKLNGDFRDSWMKNTLEPEPKMNVNMARLVDRVLEEYGWVCFDLDGTSEPGLETRWMKTKQQNYPVWWVHHHELTDVDQQWIGHRPVETLAIHHPKQFWTGVDQCLSGLLTAHRPQPKTMDAVQGAVIHLLEEEKPPMAWHQLFFPLTHQLYQKTSRPVPELAHREELSHYLAASGTATAPLIQGSVTALRWLSSQSTRHQAETQEVLSCLERLANLPPHGPQSELSSQSLRYYPAYLLFQAMGLTALLTEQWELLHTLFHIPSNRWNTAQPCVAALHPGTLVDPVWFKKHCATPTSDSIHPVMDHHLSQTLKAIFYPLFPTVQQFNDARDRLDYYRLLAQADYQLHHNQSNGLDTPGFMNRHRWGSIHHPVSQLEYTLDFKGASWAPLQAGWFGGSLNRLKEASQRVNQHFQERGHSPAPRPTESATTATAPSSTDTPTTVPV